jgi:hypothetical protein
VASSERASDAHQAASRIAVPRESGAVLCLPPYDSGPDLAIQNRRRLRESNVQLHGLSLAELRDRAREGILKEAVAYTRSLIGDCAEDLSSGPLVVTGHQPELFHAGVWAKNLATAGLARQTSAPALNLIVDNDLLESTGIQVPLGTREAPRVELVPFDFPRPQQPWEEATIVDPACFADFGSKVASRIRENWHYEPLVSQGWPAAIASTRVSQRLCDCLTAARMFVERSMGVKNLEIPMSRVCETDSFRRFAVHILMNLGSFHSIYNDAVRDYRRTNRQRSHTHTVPELDARDGWLEAPFWIWQAGDRVRGRLFARRVGDEIELRDQRDAIARLPAGVDGSPDAAITVLAGFSDRGIRLRTRALTTTLFVRLFLADLFVHGVGGAKYDVMTDCICERFYLVSPPPFLTITATLHLPLGGGWRSAQSDRLRIDHRLRDIKYNPDRQMTSTPDSGAQTLIAEKQRLLSGLVPRRPTASEHRRLAEINAKLAPSAESTRVLFEQQRVTAQRHLAANSVLESREFSWCLHSEEEIRRSVLARFVEGSAD